MSAGAAAWVLYKIDGGVDHILVDEAQDTNPAQWTIIERLAEEFFAGEGASAKLRTLFAVGDEKQSIYSFQGANPIRFGEVGRAFRAKAAAVQHLWQDVPLNLSFRSTEPVLEAVDRVFANPPAADGLISLAGTVIKHHTFRQGEAGLVERWEVHKETKSMPAEAFEPWNEQRGGARSVDELCARIAALIKHWLTTGEELRSAGRKIKAGDVLILVRRRDPFTRPMFRALKREGVPVAGADRMRLMDQLAAQDLVALADVLLMPEDDLALAVVLKSPLFGLDDEALFELGFAASRFAVERAQGKVGCRSALRRGGGNARALAVPRRLPVALRILLGPARARRPGDAQAHAHQARAGGGRSARRVPRSRPRLRPGRRSLAARLHRLDCRASDIEIKRDMEQERDEVRIMTVHGAKGLQAPIVFLPDTCMTSRAQAPRISSVGAARHAARHGRPSPLGARRALRP